MTSEMIVAMKRDGQRIGEGDQQDLIVEQLV